MYIRNVEKWGGMNCALMGHYAGSSGNFHYHYSLRKNPKDPSSQLLCGGSLKSRKWGGGLPTDLAQLHIKTPQRNNEGLVGKGARWTAEVKIKGAEEQTCEVKPWSKTETWRCSSHSFLTSELDGGGQLHVSATLHRVEVPRQTRRLGVGGGSETAGLQRNDSVEHYTQARIFTFHLTTSWLSSQEGETYRTNCGS